MVQVYSLEEPCLEIHSKGALSILNHMLCPTLSVKKNVVNFTLVKLLVGEIN